MNYNCIHVCTDKITIQHIQCDLCKACSVENPSIKLHDWHQGQLLLGLILLVYTPALELKRKHGTRLV